MVLLLLPLLLQQDPIPGLIEQLGSDSIEERELAAGWLADLTGVAERRLEETTRSSDPERAARARELVEPFPPTRSRGMTEEGDIVAINRKLETMKIDLAFEDTKLDDILAFIRDFSGLNIAVDTRIPNPPDPNALVTLKVKDLTLGKVLARLLAPLGLIYTITEEDVLLLTTPGIARVRRRR